MVPETIRPRVVMFLLSFLLIIFLYPPRAFQPKTSQHIQFLVRLVTCFSCFIFYFLNRLFEKNVKKLNDLPPKCSKIAVEPQKTARNWTRSSFSLLMI